MNKIEFEFFSHLNNYITIRFKLNIFSQDSFRYWHKCPDALKNK